jgi:hypothetical protein
MNEGSRLLARNTPLSPRLSRSVAGIAVATIFVVLVASGTTNADSQQYSVVARLDVKNAGLTSDELVVTVGNLSMPATAIKASPDIPRNIAIMVDAGPDQAKVLSKEKDLAIALINDLSDGSTSFTVSSVGTSPKMQAPTQVRSVAIGYIRDIAGESGKETNVPIYDAIGSTIRQISRLPGLRVVIFIGEGNDGGSRLRYSELRNLVESNQIAFFAALVANHSLRGAKSILRYGWNLRELASDSVGAFLENQKAPKADRQLSESIQGLRLVAFEMPSMQAGHYRISVSVRRGKRLLAQKGLFIP